MMELLLSTAPGSTSRTGESGCARSGGFVHQLVNPGEKQYTDGKGNHINGLEGFWGYRKGKLTSKGEGGTD